jgi:xanthine dehydrogenase small subunit
MLELMLNDRILKLSSAPPDLMLLDWLREQQGLTGTKEGCASGDCGACTVVVASLDSNGGGEINENSIANDALRNSNTLSYRHINACITPLHALHGRQVITIEHLQKGEVLHPVQQLVVDLHGSQCGFCTPGFVMSLFALYKQAVAPDNPQEFLTGNLCRCTGYGPLIEAAHRVASLPDVDDNDEARVMAWMRQCRQQVSDSYLQPRCRDELAKAIQILPHARLIAGGTDLALEVTQRHKALPQLIDISHVDDLSQITRTERGWRIGAAVTLSRLHSFMQQYYPGSDELFARIGSLSIRNRATMGGSLGHASPIGDIAPLLISLNGVIEVDDGVNRQLYRPEEYIIGYRQTVLKPNQWVSAIFLPVLSAGQQYAIYKVSKRNEDDISGVVLGINITLSAESRVTDCIIAAGGVAEKTVQLHQLETVIKGSIFNQSLVDRVVAEIPLCIHPISDLRMSAGYRTLMVQNLFRRFYLQCNGISVRLTDET